MCGTKRRDWNEICDSVLFRCQGVSGIGSPTTLRWVWLYIGTEIHGSLLLLSSTNVLPYLVSYPKNSWLNHPPYDSLCNFFFFLSFRLSIRRDYLKCRTKVSILSFLINRQGLYYTVQYLHNPSVVPEALKSLPSVVTGPFPVPLKVTLLYSEHVSEEVIRSPPSCMSQTTPLTVLVSTPLSLHLPHKFPVTE